MCDNQFGWVEIKDGLVIAHVLDKEGENETHKFENEEIIKAVKLYDAVKTAGSSEEKHIELVQEWKKKAKDWDESYIQISKELVEENIELKDRIHYTDIGFEKTIKENEQLKEELHATHTMLKLASVDKEGLREKAKHWDEYHEEKYGMRPTYHVLAKQINKIETLIMGETGGWVDMIRKILKEKP